MTTIVPIQKPTRLRPRRSAAPEMTSASGATTNHTARLPEIVAKVRAVEAEAAGADGLVAGLRGGESDTATG